MVNENPGQRISRDRSQYFFVLCPKSNVQPICSGCPEKNYINNHAISPQNSTDKTDLATSENQEDIRFPNKSSKTKKQNI